MIETIRNISIRLIEGFFTFNRLDLETGKWFEVSPMLEKRHLHRLVALNGRLFAIGGQHDESGQLKSVECYDPLKKKWQLDTSMNIVRSGHAAVVHDNKIYVFGGWQVEVEENAEFYDPLLDQWIVVNVFTGVPIFYND